MKSASESANKWGERASGASNDYVSGAENTSKDQASLAKASIPFMKIALNKAIDSGRVAKGLDKSGKAGWLAGIKEKGGNRYSEGVNTTTAKSKYATESGKYDSARGSASNMPRGEKGSATNLAKVTKVVTELRKVKVGA